MFKFTKKEIISIVISIIVVAFAVSFIKNLDNFLNILFIMFLVIIVNVLIKKITSYYLDSEIEMKFWEIKRYGFKTHKHFKKPFPAGIILPLITGLISFGRVVWMTPLVFDVKPKIYRSAKRFKFYSFTEMTERHIGLIAASGIIANLILALIGYVIGFTMFAKINILFALFNMIPLSDLDGDKIFFGSLILWSFLAAITLIGLFYAILIV